MFSIRNLTKQPLPRISFKKIFEDMLDKDYELSLVFAGDTRMRTLNRKLRKKDKIANTLSFLYSKTEGEIFLNINQSKEKIFHCYIHSLLHLKGYVHGKKMDKEEGKLLEKYSH